MFTGIIEATAGILATSANGLTIEKPATFTDCKIGSSISVSGVCLTIVRMTDERMLFDVVPATLKKTMLGSLQTGDRVNLERALAAHGRFDGHVVQGHVEGVGRIVSLADASIPPPLPPEEEGEMKKRELAGRNIRSFARQMRGEPTEAEEIFWKAVRFDRFGYRFRRQYPMGGRILDFYCPALKLCIEIDGEYHATTVAQAEDRLRESYLREEHGLRFIRFSNKEVLTNLPGIIDTLHTLIATISPPPQEEGSGVEAGKEMVVEIPKELLRYVVPRGSITLDGISLTIANVQKNRITIALIPQTLRETTMGIKKEGDHLNVETDILLRAVVSQKPSS